MEKRVIKSLPIGRVVVPVDFRRNRGPKKAVRIESMTGRVASEGSYWIGGIADQGKVHIMLELSKLSPEATRAFANTLLMLADAADAQLAESQT